MTISRRLAALSDSETMRITARAAALRADGKDVIGFGAGEPDFPTPDHIVAAAQAAAADPVNHHYSPAAGLPALRDAVAAKTKRDSGYDVSPSQVVITHGGKGAVFGGLAAILDPGDEVLLPAPYWVTYPEAIALAGGVARVIPTTAADGFKVTSDDLDAAVSDRTRAMIFVSPSNPTGVVYTPEETAAIGQWAAERGIWVMTDEIYEHLVYGDAVFSSIPVEVPEAAERCLVVNGCAKSYAMTGWRIGWLIAPEPVAAAVGRFQSHSMSNVANVSQRAALAAVAGPLDSTFAMREAFDRRRLTMHKMLNDIPGVESREPEGAFYAFPDVTGLFGADVGGHRVESSSELAVALLETVGIAVVPGEAFGAPGHLRLSFALGDEDLERGLTRWRQAVG
ncbi:MAG TPA: pyridoxal phosphate-dependent aminotransferase [Acidimicrobiia bacterium]|nr:pyridoxal phosphate-dependent aminotransferase [Acidimicrobiia bacterium]